MWAPGVVELDPVADHPAGVLLGFKAMTVRALLLERPDDALDHAVLLRAVRRDRSEEHTSELQSLMRISYAVFCLKKKTSHTPADPTQRQQRHPPTNNHTPYSTT